MEWAEKGVRKEDFFLSPMIAEAVAAGRAPAGINLQMLMDGRLALPPDWKDQQLMLQA
jgi:hypothetical protein